MQKFRNLEKSKGIPGANPTGNSCILSIRTVAPKSNSHYKAAILHKTEC